MIYGNFLGTLYFLVMGTDQSLLFVVVVKVAYLGSLGCKKRALAIK